ncbi:MAG: THxN family PEP-CTERM protein [Pseudomonadota bacterium]
MKSIKKAVISTAAVLGLSAGAITAQANPITDWDFTVTGEWITVGPDAPVYSAGGGTQFNSADLLSWGADLIDPAPTDGGGDRFQARSGLEVTDTSVMGSIATGAGPVDTVEVTHFNNTIAGVFASLESATFLTTLTLTPTAPAPGAPIGPVSQSIPIEFVETFNEEPCGFAVDSVCDDIFVFAPESLTFSFELDGFIYTTMIGAPGLGPLGDACDVAGAPADCIGITTPEGEETPVLFNFKIDVRPASVPAPGSLALLSLGVLGLAARRRAKRS